MSVLNKLNVLTRGILGEKVSRATAVLPATTTGNIFSITGGRVLITQIMGEVTTAIQAQACNLKISHDPDVGAAADICANADVNGLAVGTNIGITGAVAGALVIASHAYLVKQAGGLVLPAGIVTLTTSATNTGSVKWEIFYVPIDDGAVISAL